MSEPKAVLISDVHVNLNTLAGASEALESAVKTANDLDIPLIIAGDLHDTKAQIRGECIKAIRDILSGCVTRVVVIPGNHDLINAKSKEHSLEFLRGLCEIIDVPTYDDKLGLWLIPYHNDATELAEVLAGIQPGKTIIMHQGVAGANMGGYVQDRTSLPKEVFSDFRVISGHYHLAQDIKCGRPRIGAVGLFSYIGNPYTLNFGEANDGPKGFQILKDDGLLVQIPLDLRKHVVIEHNVDTLCTTLHDYAYIGKDDIIWLKVRGSRSELAKLDKADIGKKLFGHTNFKLDKIPTESEAPQVKADTMDETQLLDSLIDARSESSEHKAYLKKLWREVME